MNREPGGIAVLQKECFRGKNNHSKLLIFVSKFKKMNMEKSVSTVSISPDVYEHHLHFLATKAADL